MATEKSTELPSAPKRQLTAKQKAAVILGLLGKDTAGPLFAQLDEQSLRTFGQTMATLGDVDGATVDATVQEFLTKVTANRSTLSGGTEHALDLLTGKISETALSRLKFELGASNSKNIWSKISDVEPVRLAKCLEVEHPQVAALILTKLDAEISAAIIGFIRPELAQTIISTIQYACSASIEVVDEIARSLGETFFSENRGAVKESAPSGAVSSILNLVPEAARNQMLSFIDNSSPAFSNDVRRQMFTFIDIATRIDKRDIAKITRAVDQGILLKALSGAEQNAPAVRAMILSNISSRLADQLNEALTELGNIKAQDADVAQTEIVKAIRKLEQNGELTLLVVEED